MASSDDSTIAARHEGTLSLCSRSLTAPRRAAPDLLTRRAGINRCLGEGMGKGQAGGSNDLILGRPRWMKQATRSARMLSGYRANTRPLRFAIRVDGTLR